MWDYIGLLSLLSVLVTIGIFILQNRRHARITLLNQMCAQPLDRYHAQMEKIRGDVLDIFREHHPLEGVGTSKVRQLMDQEYHFLDHQMRWALKQINELGIFSETDWLENIHAKLDVVYSRFGRLTPANTPTLRLQPPPESLIKELNVAISMLRSDLGRLIGRAHISAYRIFSPR